MRQAPIIKSKPPLSRRAIIGIAFRIVLASAAVSVPAAAPSSPKPSPQEKINRLGAVTNFGQGWTQESYKAVIGLPVRRLRDSIRWAEVERTPGHYLFDSTKSAWPDRIQSANVKITLTLATNNPLYDGGQTPHSPEALTAFGRFAAAVVKRYPQIDTVEIGNEFNGGNFVSGPVKSDGLAHRARYHLAILKAAATAIRQVRPEITVIAGSTHSIAAGYLWPLLEMPDSRLMDGLAIHPYTTPIDQLPRQFEFLKRSSFASRLPLFITEFGSQDPALAADDLVRGYVTLAAIGAAEFDWYPLNERGDGLVPLIRKDGSLTDAGRAFVFMQSQIEGLPAHDVSPDEFTFARRFGDRVLVLWGAPRDVSFDRKDIMAFDATGAKLDPARLSLQEDRALIVTGTSPITLADDVKLGCAALIADSFYQFSYDHSDKGPAPKGLARRVRIGTQLLPFEVMDGQQRSGVPWTPYLGRSDLLALQLSAGNMVPAFGQKGGAIVQQFVAERAITIRLRALFGPIKSRGEEITLAVSHNGKDLVSERGKELIDLDVPIRVKKGEIISVALAPSDSPRSGGIRYRIQVLDEHRCASLPSKLRFPPK